MGIIKEKIDSLKNKYQVSRLSNESMEIIQRLEYLDGQNKIIELEKLNTIFKKMEHLLMLEARKTEKKINDRIGNISAINDKAFERLGVKDNTPSFKDAVKQTGGYMENPRINHNLSFEEAVRLEREKHGIPEPKPNFNPDLSFAEAVEEARRTHK